MSKVEFSVQKRENESTGALENAIIKTVTDADGKATEEQWGTIAEFDRLFDACARRWSEHGWDLEKLITAVNECSFD